MSELNPGSELTPQERAALACGRTRPTPSLEDEAVVKRMIAQINAQLQRPSPMEDLRIQQLREECQRGTYLVPAETIADGIIEQAIDDAKATLEPPQYTEFAYANTDAGRDRERSALQARQWRDRQIIASLPSFAEQAAIDRQILAVWRGVKTALCLAVSVGALAWIVYRYLFA